MELQTFTVKTREDAGKGAARQSRMKGSIPCVLYGGGEEPVALAANSRDFEVLLHAHAGSHAVLQLDVANQPALNTPVLVKDVQRHPVMDTLMHADFLRISLDERIHTSTVIELTGQCKGVVAGGVLEQQLRELEIECLALDVPEAIVVDVSGLDIGDSIHVAALEVSGKITVLTEPDRTVAAVHAPRVVKETAEGEEEAAAEGEEGEGGEEAAD